MTNTDYTILIVDDEISQREILAGYLKKKRFTVRHLGNPSEAVKVLQREHFDLVLSDFRMPEMSGFELLQKVKELSPGTDVILMTAFGSIEGAVAAMREGAYDYISKPIDLDEMEMLIHRLRERKQLISENRQLREQLIEKFSFDGIISQSSEMQSVLNTAARVAESNAPVLIRGESGTGKEMISKIIHYSSPRKEKPFIAVNCAALNENLLESELFGHEKGAFTGAEKQRRGRFELADTGTIFLDEIGDISAATQVRLLRVLQEQTFERVGGNETLSVDVRIVAATNKNLEDAMVQGVFREDLFYRLNVVSLEIPPLRKRKDDIPPLAEYFLAKYSKEQKKMNLNFSSEAWDALLRYDYPGNVRELENVIQRAVIFSRGALVASDDLPMSLRSRPKEIVEKHTSNDLPNSVELLEKDMIFEALRINDNNQSKAAMQLGIGERTLRYKLKKWGVK